MLFTSQVPQIMGLLSAQISQESADNRKVETALRLNFYHSQQLETLENTMEDLFSDPDSMVKVTLNIVRKVVDNLSQVYSMPPIRTIHGTDQDKALFKEIADKCALDVKLKQASRYTKLLKTILIRPVWRAGAIDLDILTGNILDVECGDSPEQLLRVGVTDYGMSDNVEDITYSLWSADQWERLDVRGNIIEAQENPYDVLPFLPLFDYPPTSSIFWLPGLDDLFTMQQAINLKLTDLCYLLAQQSYGVGWIRGAAGTSLRVDPGSLVDLPDKDSAIGFESQQARIEEMVGAIQRLISWAMVAHGLSAGSMSTDVQVQSGASKSWDSKELSEMRRDDFTIWRSYEATLFQLIKTVWNVHNPGKKFSDSSTCFTDFQDQEKQRISAYDQSRSDDIDIAAGIKSPVDVLLRNNPDLQGDREQALSLLLKIKEENELLQPGLKA